VRKVKRKYLVLLLIPLVIALTGCGKKKHYVASPPELEAPSNLRTHVINYKQINLSWQDNSDIEDGFKVCCDMGGSQYQTMDTLPANTTSFEHYNLQPMTKYTYYVQAYRGNQYASSREVSATTPCPVQIIDSWLTFVPNTRYKISGRLLSDAEEPCLVGLLGCLYEQETGERVICNEDKFYLKDLGKTFEIWFVVGGRWPNYDHTVEITDVEIAY